MTRLSLALIAGLLATPIASQGLGPPVLAHEKAVHAAFGARIELNDGRFFLRHAAGRLPIAATAKSGDLTVETGRCRVVVPAAMPASGWLDAALEAIPRLLAKLGHAPPLLRLSGDPLLGPHLWSDDVLVTAERVLQAFAAEGLPAIDLEAEVKALAPSLERSALSPLGRRALRRVLDILVHGSEHDEEPDPELVLRLVSRGWLGSLLPAGDALARFEAAARRAAEWRVTRLWRDDRVEYSNRENLLSWPADVLRDRQATRYRVELPPWSDDGPALDLVVELPPRADPLRDADRARAASLWAGRRRVAHWQPEAGLTVDTQGWESVRRGARTLGFVDRDYLPPHLPLVTPDGAMVALVTRHGILRPPRPDEPASFDRFVAEAAAVLPDPAHLDLLREHFFHYVHDSPDNLRPELIGVPGAVGEIHQTWRETLATSTGGRCRGDCDDLAEVFHEVARVQGRLAHIMVVPGHNALAFAEQRGTVWTVHVLHTGQPLVFRHRDLKQALGQAYQHFQEGVAFDPSQIPNAVRFSGERQRSEWLLSWRIFADARYAETLIDVQHDWHLHTFGRGLAKMEALVAAGDDDAANHLEMAGLSEQMGDWGRAADEVGKALQLVEDPLLGNALRRIDDLYRAGRVEDGRQAVQRLLATDLPDFRRRSSVPEYLQKTLELVGGLLARRDVATAVRVLESDAQHRCTGLIESLARTLNGPAVAMGGTDTLEAARSYVETALELLLEHSAQVPAPLAAAMRRDVERWVEKVARHDVEQELDFLWRDATIGRYWHLVLGPELEARLARRGMPSRRERDRKRSEADLPWVKASVPFWFGRLARLFGEDRATLDRAEAVRLARAVGDAHAALAAIDVREDRLDYLLFQARLLAALAERDVEALAALLAQARRENDKLLRDTAAEWIGEAARFLEPAAFARVLDVWDRELGYKPLYLAIAWGALRSGARPQAELAARRAVERFPDEPAFQAELARFVR